MLTINIVGCGKLGKTIGKLLVDHAAVKVLAVLNSSLESSQNAVRFIGQGKACENYSQLPSADIYLIATKDDLISNVANSLQEQNLIKKGTIFLHCSGSLSSEILVKNNSGDYLIASIHPIKSFANPESAIHTFKGTYCAIEGDDKAIQILSRIFQKIGGITFPIDKLNKKIYHASGVMANNYLVGLHYHATQCYIAAGVDKDIAKHVVSMLMKDAFENLNKLSHEKSLTGPIQRGDANTISQHISALDKVPELENAKDIYISLGKGTLSLVSHEPQIQTKLQDIFNETDMASNAINRARL